MTNLPINLNIAPSAPVQSAAQNAHASSQAAAQNQIEVRSDDENSAPAPRSRNNNANSNDNSPSFSKLLASKQRDDVKTDAKPASNVSETASPKATKDVSTSDETSNEKPKTDENSTDETPQLIIALQPLAQNPALVAATMDIVQQIGNTQKAADASAGKDAQDPLDELLKQLAALLEQALQQNAANENGTETTTAPIAATDTQASAQEETTVDTNDILALLQAMLQQQGETNTSQVTSTTDDLSITASATSAPAASPLTDALTQLAALLEKQPKQAGDAKEIAAPVPVAPDAVAQPQKSEKAKPFVEALAIDETTPQQQTPKQALTQAVNAVIDALSKDSAPKQDDVTGDLSASASSTTPVAAPAPQAPQQSDFAKHLQQAAHATPHIPVPAHDQVVVNIKNAVNDGTSQIRIQLHPEDLGKVDVQINTRADGKTDITITSDNRNTMALLQNEARALQDALRDIGLKTDAGGLNFNLRDSGQDARNSNKQQQGGYTQVAGVNELEETGFSTAGSLYRISAQQGLDIRV